MQFDEKRIHQDMNENETKMVIQNRKMLSFQLDVKDEGVFLIKEKKNDYRYRMSSESVKQKGSP